MAACSGLESRYHHIERGGGGWEEYSLPLDRPLYVRLRGVLRCGLPRDLPLAFARIARRMRGDESQQFRLLFDTGDAATETELPTSAAASGWASRRRAYGADGGDAALRSGVRSGNGHIAAMWQDQQGAARITAKPPRCWTNRHPHHAKPAQHRQNTQ